MAALPEKLACRLTVDILALAHERGCEAELATLKGQQMGGPEVEVEPVIMQPDAQAVADQAGPFWQGWTV